jgi:transcriptional regulator with XRE-family HTH domain
MYNLGKSFKLCRRVKGLTLRDVERATGVSNAYLSQIETGTIKEPGFTTVATLLKFYGIEVSDLLEE